MDSPTRLLTCISGLMISVTPTLAAHPTVAPWRAPITRTARPTSTSQTEARLFTPQKDTASGQWTSARSENTNMHDFCCEPGKKPLIEAGLKMGAGPNQLDIWPAFWTLRSPFRGIIRTGLPSVRLISVSTSSTVIHLFVLFSFLSSEYVVTDV